MDSSISVASEKRLSKAFYLISFIVASGLLIILPIKGKAGPGATLSGEVAIPMIYLTVVFCILFYKAWSSIQDGHARTTPGKAIGFLFIPFYDIYWIFQAIAGFAMDYNSFTERHNITVPKLSHGLFIVFCIVSLVEGLVWRVQLIGLPVAIVSFVIGLFVVNSTCKAVNSLP